MNIYNLIIYLIAALLIIWRVSTGFKKGLVSELSNAVSIIIALGIGYIFKNIFFGFTSHRYGMIVAYLAYLAALLLVYRLISLIFSALKIFSRLPVIKFIDKVFGALLGVIEGFLIIVFLIWLIK